jgi:hypothetical protein
MLDRVYSACVQVGGIIVSKCAKFQSHISIDFNNICLRWCANFNVKDYADALGNGLVLLNLLIGELKLKLPS